MLITTKTEEDALTVFEIGIETLMKRCPFLGFILDVHSRFAEERLRKQVQDIQEKLDAIHRTNSNAIDKAFQNTSEYNDLIFLILEKALKNRFEEKMKFFTDVCVANSLRDRPKYSIDLQEEFVKTVADMRQDEISLLHRLYNPEHDPFNYEQYEKAEKINGKVFEFPIRDYEIAVGSLYSRQLVNKIRGWSEANDHPKVTVFGVELISYMKDVSKITQNALHSNKKNH